MVKYRIPTRELPALREQRALTADDIWHTDTNPFTDSVTATAALKVAAVYGCVRVIVDNVATLPLDQFYLDDDEVRRPQRPRAKWLNFNRGPHNKIDILSQLLTSMLLQGNGYLFTHRNDDGEIVFVETLAPQTVQPRIETDGTKTFFVTSGGKRRRYTQDDITHFPGMMLAGSVKGVDPITYADKTIGISLSANTFAEAFYRNDAKPSFAIEMDKDAEEPTPANLRLMRQMWNEVHQGAHNANRMAILANGAKLKQLTVNPEDAQLLEARRAQIIEIAMLFGVPPTYLGIADAPQLGTSIEQTQTAFYQTTLRGWVERLEQGFADAERRGGNLDTIINLNVNSLMRGDYTKRATAVIGLVREGIISPNEGRDRLDDGLAPAEWGELPISVQIDLDTGNEDNNARRLRVTPAEADELLAALAQRRRTIIDTPTPEGHTTDE